MNQRLKNWLNNRLFIILNDKDWEIEEILIFYRVNNEKDSNI